MLLRSLILTGAINGIFFIVLLKNKSKNSDSDRLLMLWMGIIAFQLFFYYDNLSARPLFPGYLQLLGFSLPLINSPVLYFYICSLSFGYSFKRSHMIKHFLLFLAFNVATFFLHYSNANNLYLKDALPHFSNHLDLWIVYTLTAALAIVPGCYTVASFLVLLRHQKLLPDNYSYTEKISLDWLKWIVVSLLILFIGLFLFIKYGVNFGLVSYPNLFAVVGAILTIYVFFIGFCGLNQSKIPNDITLNQVNDSNNNTAASYKNSGLSDEKVNQIFVQLKLHMENNKPFLDEDLSLSLLAGQLGVTSNQLSQVINQTTQSNFFNFINSYRVEAVKNNLNNPAMSHYSILGIAYSCGFRSKSSFNKIFKEATGGTPLQYQKSASR